MTDNEKLNLYITFDTFFRFVWTVFYKIFCKNRSKSFRTKKTPRVFADGGNKLGLSGTIEPTILTFGLKKQFDFNTDLSFIQKGGENKSIIYSYDHWGQLTAAGSETYPVTITYLSFSPTVKVNFWKILFVKIGPRMDGFLNFKSKDRFSSEQRTSKDFNSITFGTTYGLGICTGKNKVKFICEFVGQNDFTNSSYYKTTGQTFKNFSYILNFGLTVVLKKKQDKITTANTGP
jgi:hypothetical protein